MILIITAVKEDFLEPLMKYLRKKKFMNTRLSFLVTSKNRPFSLPSFQRDFSDAYYKDKPERVVFLVEEEMGGEEHLVYALRYFQSHFSPTLPFETCMVEDEGKGKPLHIQELNINFEKA